MIADTLAYFLVHMTTVTVPESRGAAGYESRQERHEQDQFGHHSEHFFFLSFPRFVSYLQFLAEAWDDSDPQPVVVAPTWLCSGEVVSCRSPK